MIYSIEIAFTILWGFLIGFIGWGACFRLSEPIATWLLQSVGSNGIIDGITRLLVTIFFIFGVLALLSWVPIMLSIIKIDTIQIDNDLWRNLYGVSFISSLVGFFVLGFLRRFS